MKFHSAPSGSSTETNVGSPPIVRRDIVPRQVRVHRAPQRLDFLPLRLAVRPRDAGGFADACHAHFVVQLRFAFVHRAGNGRGAGRLRRAAQRNMAFAGQQPGGWVQTNPSRAGQINFAPGMQVGEILFRPAGAVEGLLVGRELDEVAGNKTGGQAKPAQAIAPAARRNRGTSRCRGPASPPAFARPVRGESDT